MALASAAVDVDSDPEWLTDHATIAETLYELATGETIAVKIEASWGTYSKHVTITAGPFPDVRNYSETSLAEPYDVVLEGDERRNPSVEDPAGHVAVSYDPETETAYLKRGVGRFTEIEGVTTDTLAVSYDSDTSLAAECDCGQTYLIPVDESDLPMMGEGLIDTDDGRVTPCCRSGDWVTTLVEK